MIPKWKKTYNKEVETMSLYTTAIIRAHGQSHPETLKVRELYIELDQTDKPENVFKALRQLTDHYKIPQDVCPTFEHVYRCLANYDDMFQRLEVDESCK